MEDEVADRSEQMMKKSTRMDVKTQRPLGKVELDAQILRLSVDEKFQS